MTRVATWGALLALGIMLTACSSPATPNTAPEETGAPSIPVGYKQIGDDVAVKWADSSSELACDRGACATLLVVALRDCPRLYAEASLVDDDGSAIDWTNDTLSGLRINDHGKIQFQTSNTEVHEFKLSDIVCS